MRHTVDLTERIRGRYEHVSAILRLDCERIVHEPLRELRVPVGRSTVARRVDAHVGQMRLVGRALGLSPIVTVFGSAFEPRSSAPLRLALPPRAALDTCPPSPSDVTSDRWH